MQFDLNSCQCENGRALAVAMTSDRRDVWIK